MLDVDAAVGGVRIGPAGSLTFDPAQSRRLCIHAATWSSPAG